MKLTLEEYEKLALRLAKDMGSLQQNLIHAAFGITSEAGKIADEIKDLCIHGKEMQLADLLQRSGDLLWFITLLARCTGTSLEVVARENIRKLRIRYPVGYLDLEDNPQWTEQVITSPYSRVVLVINETEEDSLEEAILPLTYILASAAEDEEYDEANFKEGE